MIVCCICFPLCFCLSLFIVHFHHGQFQYTHRMCIMRNQNSGTNNLNSTWILDNMFFSLDSFNKLFYMTIWIIKIVVGKIRIEGQSGRLKMQYHPSGRIFLTARQIINVSINTSMIVSQIIANTSAVVKIFIEDSMEFQSTNASTPLWYNLHSISNAYSIIHNKQVILIVIQKLRISLEVYVLEYTPRTSEKITTPTPTTIPINHC